MKNEVFKKFFTKVKKWYSSLSPAKSILLIVSCIVFIAAIPVVVKYHDSIIDFIKTSDEQTASKDLDSIKIDGVVDGKIYKTDVIIKFDRGTATLNGKPIKSGTVVSEDGSYKLIVKDKDQSKEIDFIIDKDKPEGSNPGDNSNPSNPSNPNNGGGNGSTPPGGNTGGSDSDYDDEPDGENGGPGKDTPSQNADADYKSFIKPVVPPPGNSFAKNYLDVMKKYDLYLMSGHTAISSKLPALESYNPNTGTSNSLVYISIVLTDEPFSKLFGRYTFFPSDSDNEKSAPIPAVSIGVNKQFYSAYKTRAKNVMYDLAKMYGWKDSKESLFKKIEETSMAGYFSSEDSINEPGEYFITKDTEYLMLTIFQ